MMYKHGFTLGKFMPPHNGHLHLIREAKKQCEFLTVLVCSLKAEPIDGKLRHQWLCEIFKNEKDIEIIHVAEEVPQYPEEDVNFWPIWTDLINRHVKDKEVFFSSELYGTDVAHHLSIDHICIDIDRTTYPVSGTAVRNDAFKMWNYLHPIVRQYFVKKVVLVGAESVGKSTMVRYLSDNLPYSMLSEYGREYCEINKPTELAPSDFIKIARQQTENEKNATLTANCVLICDTDTIVTEAYSMMYCGECPEEIIQINQTKRADFYILLDSDLPFEDDGTRIYLDSKTRKKHTDLIEGLLKKYNVNYIKIGGIGEERYKNVLAAFDTFLLK